MNAPDKNGKLVPIPIDTAPTRDNVFDGIADEFLREAAERLVRQMMDSVYLSSSPRGLVVPVRWADGA